MIRNIIRCLGIAIAFLATPAGLLNVGEARIPPASELVATTGYVEKISVLRNGKGTSPRLTINLRGIDREFYNVNVAFREREIKLIEPGMLVTIHHRVFPVGERKNGVGFWAIFGLFVGEARMFTRDELASDREHLRKIRRVVLETGLGIGLALILASFVRLPSNLNRP
jgi:hypothetical protein